MNGMVYVVLVRFLAQTAQLRTFASLAKADTIITASPTLVSRFVQDVTMLLNSFAFLAILFARSALMPLPTV